MSSSGTRGESDSLLSSQLTGREFGGSAAYTDDPAAYPKYSSSLSLTGSTISKGRPTALLNSNESLTSITSGSKPPSERSNISLTPPSSRFVASHGSHLHTTYRLVTGLVIVVVIAVSWVGSTQTAKSSFTTTGNGTRFKAPFFVMWFGTGWMMVVYPLSCVLFFVTNRDKWSWVGIKELWSHSTRLFSPNGITPLSLLTSTVPFTVIWGATNYMYIRALTVIQPSDVTALFSCAPVFVFILSFIILREPLLIFRLVAVVMAVGGIVLFAYEDGFKGSRTVDSVVGVALSLGSAVGVALYKVLLKVRVKEASVYQMSLFLSLLGAFSTVAFWPFVLALQYTNVEKIHGHNIKIPWQYICASSALAVVFNFSINFGVAYAYPLFISLGTVLGIPLNGVVDLLVRNANLFTTWKFTATDLIVTGFLLMLLPPRDSRWVQRTCCCSCCCCDRQWRMSSSPCVNQSSK